MRELIAALHADPAARDAARDAYDAPARWRAPLPEATRLAAVHAHSGVPQAQWKALDAAYHEVGEAAQARSPDRTPLTPAMAIDLASAALADCEQLGTAGRAACLDRALQIETLVTRDGE